MDDLSAGVVLLRFVVLDNGNIASMEVMQGIDPKVDYIVKSEFEKLANYNPGKNQGQHEKELEKRLRLRDYCWALDTIGACLVIPLKTGVS